MPLHPACPEQIDPLDRTSARTHRRSSAAAIACVVAVSASAFVAGPRARAEIATAAPAPGTPAIISNNIDPTTGFRTTINSAVGALRFYRAGYWGALATLANVEAGYVWNGHETLGNVTSFISNSPANATANQYDYHATMVGFTMVGQGYPYYDHQIGMAPEAGLSSVAIAADWVDTSGAFDINTSTFVYGYNTVMSNPVTTTHQYIASFSLTYASRVDVVNSSWGFYDPAGLAQYTKILDSLTYANHQTVCLSAGNHDPADGTTPVSGPATAFNAIAVAALGTDLSTPKYGAIADFSNTGPNSFYNPVTGLVTPNVRAAVSIAAPGTDLILAAYTGATGTNSSGTLFDTSAFPPEDLNKLYFQGAGGTSFASPIVAGGAGLVVDAGYANFGGGVAVDGRVVKAVLLNSARKTTGWTNNTVNVGGVLTTAQGLDWNVGAGALDLNAAYDQYLTGTTNDVSITGGTVHDHGWAFGHVALGAPNDYFINTPLLQGTRITATLTWFVPVYFNTAATADPLTDAFSDTDLHDLYFDQLGLQVWLTDGAGLPTTLVADSHSPYNTVDHLYFDAPQDGTYAIRVSFLGTTYDLLGDSPLADDYALAWSVPEPLTAPLLVLGVVGLCVRRVRRRGARRA
jgi:hypothetical protein